MDTTHHDLRDLLMASTMLDPTEVSVMVSPPCCCVPTPCCWPFPFPDAATQVLNAVQGEVQAQALEGLGLGDGLGFGEGVGEGMGEGLGEGEGVGAGVGEGVGLGVGVGVDPDREQKT